MHPDITRSLANERHADMVRDADRSRLAREARGEGHESLLARMRERLSRTPSRERRVFRPARAS